MSVKGFTSLDFETFKIEGLDERMTAIAERIRPKFQEIGDILATDLSVLTGKEMFLHIAKHARRTVNPPKDTWLAICDNKRGYKQHPHFQLGLFDDHLFIWLAFIYELPNKQAIASNFLHHQNQVSKLIPKDYVISLDHTKKDATTINTLGKHGLADSLQRFHDVKKAELLVGRHLSPHHDIVQNGEALIQFARETYEKLLPLYKLSYQE
ncbi:YktB family protein [Bacillus salitolerans]|uniref:UPF0637 protein ACFSCX_03680 n=1 Tax=Bacillus salitolerans TaxID=1437434 RepID=A0ABW4LMD1_9BACI